MAPDGKETLIRQLETARTMRWLNDPALDGPTNMARDEALLRSVGEGNSPPTLRFYRWTPPTISLGYFQRFEEFAALPAPAGQLPVVRRLTGGGAILHDRELTYALVLPVGHDLLRHGGPNNLYDHVHGAFADLLQHHGIPTSRGPKCARQRAQHGPFFCFDRHSCFDLLANGRKIMGSAQRRTTQAILQHGSLILDRRFDQQTCAAVADFTPLDIDNLLPELAHAITGPPLPNPAALTPAELERTDHFRTKYADPLWTRERQCRLKEP